MIFVGLLPELDNENVGGKEFSCDTIDKVESILRLEVPALFVMLLLSNDGTDDSDVGDRDDNEVSDKGAKTDDRLNEDCVNSAVIEGDVT